NQLPLRRRRLRQHRRPRSLSSSKLRLPSAVPSPVVSFLQALALSSPITQS
ncbi:hypothetical protein HN873_027624, partial [Arachis hypogaea]